MFHLTDGLFFERLPDNQVRILKCESGRDDAPIVFDITLDAHSWASVIASMSYYEEEDNGFNRALNFHRGDPIHETTPLVDKLAQAATAPPQSARTNRKDITNG
jgi:hypothetical protein